MVRAGDHDGIVLNRVPGDRPPYYPPEEQVRRSDIAPGR
jgi:hypothetical protein